MPITRSDLTNRTGPRGRRAEYTRKCGWIDWAHATPDRDDLKAIWSALYPLPILPNGRVDADRISLIRGKDGSLYGYIKVDFSLEMNWKQRLGSRFPKQNYTFFVKWQDGDATAYYKRAALALYLYGCAMVEYHQSSRILEWKAASSFAMEDMISNLMAFYQLVENIPAATLIERAGGWTNGDEALKMSTAVFDAMDRKDVAQPKALWREWYKAYLFNDVAGIDDQRGGWQMLPAYFLSIQPLPWSQDNQPGADIGYEWDVYEAGSAALVKPGQKPTEQLAQLRPGGRHWA